jgi:hypothetical protein
MASSFGRIRLSTSYRGPWVSGAICIKEDQQMSTTAIPDRFTTLPDERALQATVVALEEHGFSVEVVGDLDAARRAVLARIPEGSSVMTNTSVTLDQTGLADAINDGGGRWAYKIAEEKDLEGWVVAFTEDGTFTDESIGVTYRGPDELPKTAEI